MKKIIYEESNPWLFNNTIFNDPKDYAGFTYLITIKDTNQKYIGKKFFWSKRKLPGQVRRKTIESDWKKYYSSCKELKLLVKNCSLEERKNKFRREILSLHKLERDVNYMEVYFQFVYSVLTESTTETWLNENIL